MSVMVNRKVDWKTCMPREFRRNESPAVIVLLTALLATVISVPSTVGVATGEMYQFVDRDGILRVTNVPNDHRYVRIEWGYERLKRTYSQKDLNEAIAWYGKQQRIDPNLIRAVIMAESGFNPLARSRTGAMGLMQLMPKTAASLKVGDPYNPVENIRGGARHLRYLLDRFKGELPLALAAYNAGEAPVKRHKKVPPYRETRRYVKKVLRFYRDFKSNAHSSSPYHGKRK